MLRAIHGGRILRIPDELQRVPMLDAFQSAVHSVNVDAGDPPVSGIICQEIHKFHVSEYV